MCFQVELGWPYNSYNNHVLERLTHLDYFKQNEGIHLELPDGPCGPRDIKAQPYLKQDWNQELESHVELRSLHCLRSLWFLISACAYLLHSLDDQWSWSIK